MFNPVIAFARQVQKRGSVKTANFQAIKLMIDRPQGTVQKGVDEHGTPWERTYKLDYGYIPGTHGGDGDGLDCYLGPDEHQPDAYWVSQQKLDGSFDEYKVMLGFPSAEAAKAAYLEHTPEKYFGSMSATSTDMMKALLGVHPNQWATAKALGVPMTDRAAAFAGYLAAANMDADGPIASLMIAKAWSKNRACAKFYDEPELWKSADALADRLSVEGPSASSVLARAHAAFLADSLDALPMMLPDPIDVIRLKRAVLQSLHAELEAAIPLDLVLKDDGAATTPSVADITAADVPTLAPQQGDPRKLSRLLHPEAPTSRTDPHAFVSIQMEEDVQPTEVAKDFAGSLGPRISHTFELVERQQILGFVLIPDVIDSQGDTYSALEVEKSAHFYMEHFRNVGLMHKGMVNDKVKLVESYIAEIDMTIGGSVVPKGSWLMKVRVVDPELWQACKDGKFRGFSIGGFAQKDQLG